jgi:hypothetical protein
LGRIGTMPFLRLFGGGVLPFVDGQKMRFTPIKLK